MHSAQVGGVSRECGKYECCSELQENTDGAEGVWSCELCKRGLLNYNNGSLIAQMSQCVCARLIVPIYVPVY